MKKENDKKIEDFLKIFAYKPAPPGLKEKILRSALQRKQSSPVITPFIWKGFVTTLILLIIVMAVDATVSSNQNGHLSSFLDLPQESSDRQEEEWSMLKDIIWDPLDKSENAAKKKFYTLREDSEINKRQPEWREILEEEFEYHESTKNLP
jgi:hypothetical protein